jgi:hypothetical protein
VDLALSHINRSLRNNPNQPEIVRMRTNLMGERSLHGEDNDLLHSIFNRTFREESDDDEFVPVAEPLTLDLGANDFGTATEIIVALTSDSDDEPVAEPLSLDLGANDVGTATEKSVAMTNDSDDEPVAEPLTLDLGANEVGIATEKSVAMTNDSDDEPVATIATGGSNRFLDIFFDERYTSAWRDQIGRAFVQMQSRDATIATATDDSVDD